MATAEVSALDLRQDDDDGFPWSFRLQTMEQNEVEEEVDPDVYLATLCEISFTDEMVIETADGGAIHVSFAGRELQLPASLGMQCSGDVNGRRLRYATIQPQHMEDSRSMVWLSVWTPDYSSTENVYVRMEDLPAATRLLNALRRLQFVTDSQSTIRLEKFFPRIAAFYDVCVERKSPSEGASETTPEFQPRFCVVDEEAFAMYADVLDLSPKILLRFQLEPGRDVIECMYMNKKTKMVKIVNNSIVVMVRQLNGGQRECDGATSGQGAPADEQDTYPADQVTQGGGQVTAQGDQGTEAEDDITASGVQMAAPVGEEVAQDKRVAVLTDHMTAGEPEADVYLTTPDLEKTVSYDQVTLDDQVAALNQVAAPVDQVAAQVDQVAAPDEQVAAPVDQVTTLIAQVAAPDDQVAAPVDQVSAPVDQVSAPVDQVAAPVDQVASPVDQVPAPVDQVASLNQMAASVDQVASPNQMAAPVDEMGDDQQTEEEIRTPVGDYDQLLKVLKDIKCKPASIFKDIEAYKNFFNKGSAGEVRETMMPTTPLEGGRDEDEPAVAGLDEEEIEDVTSSDPEDVRLMLWEVAEVEITSLIENGLVPDSTMISAGLNPNSKEDFQKCIGEIQDALFAGEYGMSVSYINGVREVFSPSLYNRQLTQLMDYDNTLKILKHVFFAADRVISMCLSPS